MKKKNPLVSVVIPTWNRKEDLERAVSSVKNQSYKNVEIIVVDNHSTDGTYELLKNKFLDVVVIRLPSNYGTCAALDIGFLNARGDIIMEMDDDSYLQDSKVIEKAVPLFEKYPKLGILSLRILTNGEEETKDWGKNFCVSEAEDMWIGNTIHGGLF